MVDSAQVRITTTDGRLLGAGTRAGGHVLTCAHVLARDEPGRAFRVEFPLARPGLSVEAELVSWRPRGEDLAVVKPAGALPFSAPPLCDGLASAGHEFRCFGYPAGHPDGVWTEGRVVGQAGHGLQLEAASDRGLALQRGFSGAPVWDTRLRAVIGIVAIADTTAGVRTGFGIAGATLRGCVPDLPDPRVTEYLRVRGPSGTVSIVPLSGECVVHATLTVGRPGPGRLPDIPLGSADERWISRNHCALERDPESGRWTVRDLGSRNGTLLRVGGELETLSETTRLRPGDVICVRAGLTADHRQRLWELEYVDELHSVPAPGPNE
ncbi:trypsin-like peptidase domain-containing protein [Amycolatopsis alkalitolerans]|uniref:FHA domain-containing protein n=1 Tax=Amycolatopsis alkalitolerans TaxID=2547244 RepID=A0A5C4LSZ3_9PSEU|nr:trypsin-like peptidase domain-containing protein [Amycolatopsis alkalitolerans]TNC20301.1 FHA domain-containing protein [Amycolatopsis alkalitolerans]